MFITNKWMRDTLARFRLRACGLKNLKQWFTTDEQNAIDLICPVCGQGSEDEVHFIFHCQAYTELRKKYTLFDSITTQPNMNHVSTILASKDETEITSLAKYIVEALRVRKKKIEQQNNP
jgi:hypothetical protein